MSKYTTEVRFICESKSGYDSDQISQYSADQIIAAARTHIFDFNYPIYDVNHKPELETKILKHYYTREIAAETYGLWKLWLNDKLNLIMPKYNKLYAAEHAVLTKELQNIDVETHTVREDDFTRTDNLSDTTSNTRTDNLTDTTNNTRTDNLTQTNDGTTTDKYSDTPQGSITGVDNNTYLTDYRVVDNDETIRNTGTQTNAGAVTHTGTQTDAGSVTHTGTQKNAGDQEITTTEEGYRGSKLYAELLSDYAEKVLNIDQMIVNELSDLFFLLW